MIPCVRGLSKPRRETPIVSARAAWHIAGELKGRRVFRQLRAVSADVTEHTARARGLPSASSGLTAAVGRFAEECEGPVIYYQGHVGGMRPSPGRECVLERSSKRTGEVEIGTSSIEAFTSLLPIRSGEAVNGAMSRPDVGSAPCGARTRSLNAVANCAFQCELHPLWGMSVPDCFLTPRSARRKCCQGYLGESNPGLTR